MRNKLLSVMIILCILWGKPAVAMSLEELAEILCDNYDGVSCQFEEKSGVYKFGSKHIVYGGNGQIRSHAAYCLLRDGNGATANANLGTEDWDIFGGQSRLHTTFAGQNGAGVYQVGGQRVLDLVLFGVTLEGIEVQDFMAHFPEEMEKPKKSPCRKWLQIGNKKICTQFVPTFSERTGYYMTLDTHAYEWEIDVDEVASDLSQLFGGPPMPDGLEVALGQKVPFEYYGSTELGGVDLILNDGTLPQMAFSGNLWEWGLNLEGEDPTSYLDAELPIADVDFASLTLFIKVGLNGYYKLQEGPLVTDPDTGQLDTPPVLDELTTSTHLAARAAVDLTLTACLDFGWFGEWCGDFVIVDEEDVESRDPLNEIAYSLRGTPLSSLWSDGSVSENSRTVAAELDGCLNAETLVQEPEDVADPTDVAGFLGEIAGVVSEHYEACFVEEPENTVSYTQPSFKLCDDRGRVYDAIGEIRRR